MKTKNKWRYIFVIIGRSAYGKEDIDSFDTYSETRKMVKEYQMALPTYSFTIIKRKELNE